MPAVLTPPTAPPICLTIPRNVMQNQYNFCSYLSQCHELWEQADLYVVKRGVCESKIYYLVLDLDRPATAAPQLLILTLTKWKIEYPGSWLALLSRILNI